MDDDDLNMIDEYTDEIPAIRFAKLDVVVLALNFGAQIAQAFADTPQAATAVAAMHANYRVEKHRFHEQAALEIETMTNGDTDG